MCRTLRREAVENRRPAIMLGSGTMSGDRRIVIACALKKEVCGLREHLTSARKLIVTGLGTDRTLRALEQQLERFRPALVIFTGMAGQLDPALGLGELVIPQCWRFESGDEFPVSTALVEGLRGRGWKIEGKGVTVRIPVVRQAHRLKVFRETGARICDMESAAVLMICQSFGIPCVAAKIVSDTADSGMLAFYRHFQHNIEVLAKRVEELAADAERILAL